MDSTFLYVFFPLFVVITYVILDSKQYDVFFLNLDAKRFDKLL